MPAKAVVATIAQQLHSLGKHLLCARHLHHDVNPTGTPGADHLCPPLIFLLAPVHKHRDSAKLLGCLQSLRAHVKAKHPLHAHLLPQPSNGVNAQQPGTLDHSALIGAIAGEPAHVQRVHYGGQCAVRRRTDT
eukprot:CAMPEP_0179118534 /NCGR_PEP_ID=MMETSP0796-20121207/55752_1 /TAXON_ID=73915 /ORGANISM="Pyrodinium bahamense, Strain pbaha01" /LENGTH=132 /DNA_ID=CAMNT_0020816993 /DNA_START=331 /DNA_END=728 /DNA_ORIENTATION=+